MKRVLAFAIGAAVGCAAAARADSTANPALAWSSAEKRVLLIEPDIELGELTVGGVVEPRADWSDRAAHNVEQAFAAALGQHGVNIEPLNTLSDPHEIQLAKLQGEVGLQVLEYQLGLTRLPTKHSALDWTLGSGANEMHVKYGADYGLFVVVRDTYSSKGRKAMMLLGLGTGGTQVAFVSLVDLRTGNIAWFNRLLTEYGGDLREPKGASEFASDLLEGSPL